MRTLIAAALTVYGSGLFAGDGKTLPDSVKKEAKFELSFGQSLIFVSYDLAVRIRNSTDVVLPTSSILFFTELRPFKKVRFPVFFNLPTEAKQFLVSGQLVYERASPTFGTGITYNPFHWDINKRTALEFELGPLASFLIKKSGSLQFAPVGAGRLRILRDKDFVMYIGTSYSIGINAWGLLYGTGFFF
jgi:hypothetical protein